MKPQIEKILDELTNNIPGVYNIVYESGGTGVEFDNPALESFVGMLIFKCMQLSNQSLSKHEMPSDKIAEYFGM